MRRTDNECPEVKIAALIGDKSGQTLYLKGDNPYDRQAWMVPYGDLGFGEAWDQAVMRIAEQHGIILRRAGFLAIVNTVFTPTGATDQVHEVVLWMNCIAQGREPALPADSPEFTWASQAPAPMLAHWDAFADRLGTPPGSPLSYLPD